MRKVEVKIQINTSSKNVIAAFLEPDMLKKWWKVEQALIEKKIRGVYTLAWDITKNGFGFISTGKIKEYLHGELLVIDNLINLNPNKPFFGPMTLTISTKAISPNLTELHLCQDGYQSGDEWDWYYEAVKVAWPGVLSILKEYLEK